MVMMMIWGDDDGALFLLDRGVVVNRAVRRLNRSRRLWFG